MDTTKLREMLGISRIDFSRKYGIPYRTLEDWDAGRRHPPVWVEEMITRIVKEDAEKEQP